MENEVKAIYKKSNPVESKRGMYPGFKQETRILPKGYKNKKSAAALECDIIFERDVAVTLRDGTTIYTDILRPNTEEPVPAVVAWSPYGKNRSSGVFLSFLPGKMGVGSLSNLEKCEGPDPAYWCKHGYAVCQPDIRGTFKSEGNISFWGTQDGRDGCDFVEWVSGQNWCNGKVGMTGNSWLAISQWYIAAEQPKGLAAIAPWEGHSDLYRDDVMRGGIPNTGFNGMITALLCGDGETEDLAAITKAYPLVNSFWEDRRVVFEKIKTPAYIVGSYSNPIHVMGTFRAWESIASEEKWFRIHDSMEWPDYYNPANEDDLRKFFDYYLKGVDNGWENTPRIRAAILDLGGENITNRALDAFPPTDAVRKTWYLRANQNLLSEFQGEQPSDVTYVSDDGKDKASFIYEFDQDTTLLGYGSLKLWIEALGADDADVYVQVEKIGTDGKARNCSVIKPEGKGLRKLYELLPVNAFRYSGPNARLRASLRHVDETRSTQREAYHTFDRVEKLNQDEAVALVFNLGPVGMKFQKGEKLKLTVAGHDPSGGLAPGMKSPKVGNPGSVAIKTGGQYDSCLSFHVVDPKKYSK